MQKFFEELRAAAAYNITIPRGIIIKREKEKKWKVSLWAFIVSQWIISTETTQTIKNRSHSFYSSAPIGMMPLNDDCCCCWSVILAAADGDSISASNVTMWSCDLIEMMIMFQNGIIRR